MRIKSLVLHGFKSFADKETIIFNNGISCIVGPNGSGKSNMLDAIKWIMGEQNIKELRGGEIDDIVFNGSKNREPSNIATVILTLNDIDEVISEKWSSLSDISITRKYYRTGEREYYINNRNCRLKDVKEFFYDIGISHKSIILIEQGKVDKIVQSNPEELREIFEEFSGIVNYKDKKKEAQKKLESTKINLSRIKDIYNEVESNKKEVASQISELEKYKKFINEKKIIQKTLFSINYKHIIETLEKQNDEKNVLKEKKSLLDIDLNNITKIYEDKLQKLSTLKKEYSIINERYNTVKYEIDKNKNSIKINEEKINLYKDELSRLCERIKTLQIEINESGKKQNLLIEKINSISQEFDKIKALKEQQEISQGKLITEINSHSNNLKEIEKNIYKLMDEEKKIDQSIYEKQVNIKNIKNELARINKDKKYIELEKDGYIKKHKEILFKENELQKKYSLLEEQLNKKQVELNKVKALYDNEYKKLNEKEQNKSKITNRIFLLRDLIQQIVIGESKSYKKFIEKFAFIPLIDKIEMTGSAEVVCYGNIVVFKDELKNELMSLYDDEFWPINFIFEGELEDFKIKMKAMSARLEKNNLIYNGLYYMGKNANDSREELLKYREELINLEQNKKNIESDIKYVSENLSKINNNLKSNEASLKEISSELNVLYINLEKIKNEKDTYNREVKKIDGRNEILDKEEKRLNIELTNYVESLEKESNSKDKLKKNLMELDNTSKILRTTIEKLNDEYTYLNNMIVNITIKYKELGKEKEVLEQMQKEVDINLAKRTHELLDLENKSKNYNKSKSLAENEVIKLNNELTILMKNSDDLFVHNKHLLHEIEILDLEVNNKKVEMDVMIEEIKGLDTKFNRYLVNEAKILSDKDNLESQYIQLYNIPITEEYKIFYKKENTKELNEKLLKIQEDIDQLGFINMGAEVEYKKLEERSAFLKNQTIDLEGAIDKITEMIYNFDKESINRFNDTFHEVKENFKKVVKILFNGGSADIKILNDDDLLNSGIEIYIQPPGKKLQNMNLLSGGEKALMSCALLFAFFLYRKAPFCFLDEVDAPLDDANIGRFLHVVKTLSVDTQFFIISHNYNTMVESDSVYGITMKEPGISGIYSLKREDFSVVP